MAVLNEEQTMLKDAASGWATEYAPVGNFRRMRDAGETFAPAHYKDMADMGWPGVLVPESLGGAGLGLSEMIILQEELGRHLVASPLVSSGVIAVMALRLLGTEQQQSDLLPTIADGSDVVALALDEGSRHDPSKTMAHAQRTDQGYRLSGVKTHIPDAMMANRFLILARTANTPGTQDGLSLFLTKAEHLAPKPLSTLDQRDYGRLELDGTTLPHDALIGPEGGAYPAMDQVLDCARIALAAELLGLSEQAFELTLDYLKTRKQFDTVLAQFQAIQHRMAELMCQRELVRSVVEHAARAYDAGAQDATESALIAKSMSNDFANLMTRQMVQLHGGIGMTDLHDAGLFLKRARALEALYGNTAWHNERYAQLNGY